MHDIVPYTTREVVYFVAQKCADIDVFNNEFCAPDDMVKAIAEPAS